MELKESIVVVTGAAGAIGRVTVHCLLQRGVRGVLAVDIDAEGLEDLQGDAPREVLCCHVADVAKPEDAAGIAKAAESRFGRADVLINNAALLSGIGPLWEVEPEKWWADVTTNLYGTFLVTRAFLPAMQSRGTGVVINLTGGGLDRANPGASGYGCSKVAIARYTDTLANELRPWPGIRVFVLAPGFVRSTITRDLAAAPDEQDWFIYVRDWLAEGKDNPASSVADSMCSCIHHAEELPNGRVFFYNDDFEQLAAMREAIERDDIRQVRFTKERGLSLKSDEH